MKLIRTLKLPEANIQAEFYMACKQNQLNCYLQYIVDNPLSWKKHGKCRFDAVIYDSNDEIFAIIEIKSYHRQNKQGNRDTKQLKKYTQFNVPIFILTRIEHIPDLIKQIFKIKSS